MHYETLSGLSIPKIGFGTWRIGGGSSPNPKADPVSLAALRAALEVGYTHFDTAENYADGHAEELLGRALRETNTRRENLFFTTKVSPEHLQYERVLKSCENSLRRLQMEYLDLYLIHWPRPGMKLEDTFRALNKLVTDGKVKHVGVSNFSVNLLKRSQEVSETPILTNQVPFSLSDRSYVNSGMLAYCQQNEILLTAYSPVKNVDRISTLHALAETHQATPAQIALAWVISHPRVITIPMSSNPQHIKENFEATHIELTEDQIKSLNALA